MGHAKVLHLAIALALTSCLRLEPLKAVGPVVALQAPVTSMDATAGQTIEISAQALDVNGAGVNQAWVTFTTDDTTRITWLDAPLGGDAVTEETAAGATASVSGDGIATARATIPAAATDGDATVFAVLKAPADDTATLTARIVVHVKAAPDAGTPDADSGTEGSAAGMGGTGS
jgi:hypothetical protein